MNLKPLSTIQYPPFKNGMYMEEFFDSYWKKESFSLKERFIYLDIYWNNLFNIYNSKNISENLTHKIIFLCNEAKKLNKFVFTVCQWDDGPQLQFEKPDNFIIFAIGGSNNIKDKAINLPLITQDITYRLRDTPRCELTNKKYLASFIGTYTHSIRSAMVETLQTCNEFIFIVKDGWSIDISQNEINLFIETTLQSKFGLAPRGYGISSFRFFEIMELGVIPVYIYDNEIGLPYLDILDYSKFAVIINNNQLSELPNILKNITNEDYLLMLRELERVKLWFTPFGVCNYIREYLVKLI